MGEMIGQDQADDALEPPTNDCMHDRGDEGCEIDRLMAIKKRKQV